MGNLTACGHERKRGPFERERGSCTRDAAISTPSLQLLPALFLPNFPSPAAAGPLRTLRVPRDFQTVAGAIKAAAPGHEVPISM